MIVHVDPSQPDSLTDQIVKGIQRFVEERELRAETRLPSIRKFGKDHNVSKFTVVQAYDRLVASGHIQPSVLSFIKCRIKAFLITTQAKRNLSSRSGIGGVLSAT